MTWTPEFLSVNELCAALDIDRATLWRWRQRGKAPASYKVGQKVLFKKEDVDRWLETSLETGRAS